MLAVTYPELNQPVMGQQPEQAPPAFHLLAKPTGAACNLDCAYCFFLEKEVFYPGSKFRMSELVLEQYIRQLIESHQTKSVNIAWQGGEPTLMGLGFYRRTIDLVKKYRRPGMTFLHTMQTNGTLLDDDWGRFLAEYKFLAGISLDGPQELHDYYRRDAAGRGTWERVMAGIDACRRHGVEYNILVLLNDRNVQEPDRLWGFFMDQGIRYLQFVPCVEIDPATLQPLPAGTSVSERSVSCRSSLAASSAQSLTSGYATMRGPSSYRRSRRRCAIGWAWALPGMCL